jgi:hypothetical protein
VSRPPDAERPSLSLTDTTGGIAVIGLTLLVLLYSLVAIGNILLGVLLSVVLVGGYLAVQLLRELLSLFARLVTAREREARATEVRAAAAAESTGVEFDLPVDGRGSTTAEVSDDRETETESDEEWAD